LAAREKAIVEKWSHANRPASQLKRVPQRHIKPSNQRGRQLT
jgi:hypothetical protein